MSELYQALNATPTTVLNNLEEPEFAEEKVFNFLQTFIGDCRPLQLT